MKTILTRNEVKDKFNLPSDTVVVFEDEEPLNVYTARLTVIKAVRDMFPGMGLVEAKHLVDLGVDMLENKVSLNWDYRINKYTIIPSK